MEHLKSDEDGVVEFALFRWPFGHTIPCRADSASRVDGLLVQFFGFKIEAKDEAVHITVWSNMQRRKKFSLFSENRPLHLPAQKPDDIKLFAFNPKDFDKLLATLLSPLTEVFTGYGALKAFNTNVADYEDRLSRGGAKATAGYVDSVVLKTVEEVKVSKKAIEDNPRLELLTGPAVRLLVGWSSHEKRLKAMNSEGPVKCNSELLRRGCQKSIAYNAKLRELVPAIDPEDPSKDLDESEDDSDGRERMRCNACRFKL